MTMCLHKPITVTGTGYEPRAVDVPEPPAGSTFDVVCYCDDPACPDIPKRDRRPRRRGKKGGRS